MGKLSRSGARLLIALTLPLLGIVRAGTPASAQVFEGIHSYNVSLTVQPDGTLSVVEQIAYDFGDFEHHGIFRDIPVRYPYPQDNRYERIYKVHVESVAATGGASAKTKTSNEGDLLHIQIGDPKKTVTGLHVYTITYSVQGTLNAFPDHDELYWNAIGSYWSVSIDQATVHVNLPADVQRVACFEGDLGSSLPCETATSSGRTATFAQSDLHLYQGVTIVIGFPKGTVSPAPKPILDERWALHRAFALTPATGGLAGGLLLLVAGVIAWLLWSRGRDVRAVGSAIDAAFATPGQPEERVPLFEHGATPVEYAPPENIRPGQVGTLIDEVANPLDVTATVVDLAVRGYLRIEEIPKKGWRGRPDWRLVKLKESDHGLLEYEQKLFDGLFGAEPVVEDDDEPAAPPRPDAPGTKATVLPPGIDQVRLSQLRTHFAAKLQAVQDSLYDDMTKEGWFLARPDKIRMRWHVWGFLLLDGGIAATVALAAWTHAGLLGIPLVLGGLFLMRGAHLMPRRTAKGTGMVRRVYGFRTYIDTAEKQEARFQEQENIFSKYLPYAVVFGLTEKWARAFQHLGDEEAAMASGGWYVGSRAFTMAAFTSSLSSFTTVSAGTIAAAAPSSSSGHSGFSGGGSGGGGGGGGGGSW
jgi:hypothetical protein